MTKKQAADDAAQQVRPREAKAAKSDSKPKEPRINPITRFIRYVEASRAELRKVTWPTLKETRKATLAVLSFVGIMAIILGLIDLGLSSLIKTILS